MGKRKERRLAALSNAGRRVKLDLFAEPSEGLGGSSVNGEVDGELKHHDGLPKSPTSSGQQSPNPLLLLGQYSDDEVDDESGPENSTVEGSLADHDDQVKESLKEESKDAEVVTGEGLVTQNVSQQDAEKDSSTSNALQNQEGCNNGDQHAPSLNDSFKDKVSTEQMSGVGASEVQVVGDVGSGWRIVMHEETNQYYYWNTETGETSWEIPSVLAQTSQSAIEQRASTIGNIETAPGVAHDSLSTSVIEQNYSSAALLIDSMGNNLNQSEMYSDGPPLDVQDEGYRAEYLKDKILVGDGNDSEYQCDVDKVNTHLVAESLAGGENNEYKIGVDHSSELVKQCERLLERLKSLKASEDHPQGHGWMSNYILEVEIRLSDIKSLLSYGSSLLPFWVHSERQLKQLESVINDKIYQLAKSVAMDEAEEPSGEELEKQEGKGNESEGDGKRNDVHSIHEVSIVSTDVDILAVDKKHSNSQSPPGNAAVVEGDTSFGSPSEHLGDDDIVSEQVNRNAHFDEADFRTGYHAGEDDDMDVEMEVEEAVPVSGTTLRDVPSIGNFAPTEKLNVSADCPAPPPDEWIPPPPPDNEQVPPPPPDSELIPPPPPDEPPETSYPPPPSYTETGQPLSCTEQYNLTYPDSSYQYYGHMVAEVPVSNFYGHADGCQVVIPQPSIYYEQIPSLFSEAASVIVNPVQPVAYYDLQGRVAASIPVASGTESSPIHYSDTIDGLSVAGPSVRVDGSAANERNEVASVGVSSSSITIQVPATVNTKETVSATSTSTAISASSSAPKVQSKALRTKKRTVPVASSLRSNKKVSSLVDKWKAAKEELNENEEDEPDNALEILEKKRQREIEEWRAQQIASGEAKDNANFQPLGGDWREKVKRRRAQKAKEAAETPADVPSSGNQQPDLAKLSKKLPSGWQAYWDETSKQVYYGNVNTSETTWTRPTK